MTRLTRFAFYLTLSLLASLLSPASPLAGHLGGRAVGELFRRDDT